jgi:hypothetical protein
MPVIFPHANDYELADDDFRSAWIHLRTLYPGGPRFNQLPRLPRRDTIRALEANRQQLSLEYLCRRLVPNGYKDTSHATQQFLAQNAHIVCATSTKVINPASDLRVAGVELIGALPGAVPVHIEALFEADVDDDAAPDSAAPIAQAAQAITRLSASVSVPAGTAQPALCTTTGFHHVSPCVLEFVRDVHTSPYVARYRLNPVPPGVPVYGWDDRLTAYFWPKPGIGPSANLHVLSPLLVTAQLLEGAVSGGHPWTANENTDAVAMAHGIFAWGGVPQKAATVTSLIVRNVFEAALNGSWTMPGAPMNSGWTKVVAFATSHLPVSRSHVIWDSRVSTSIVRRLDRIFHALGLTTVPAPYTGIGLVNAGRGGTRPIGAGALSLAWNDGYRSWDAQEAGSDFVRLVCNALNLGAVSTARKGHWTVRDVEMVLFGDGY